MPAKPTLAAITLMLGLTLGGDVLAADPPAPSTKRPSVRMGNEDRYASSVFQTLVAEFALRRGDIQFAADIWTDLAQRTRNPEAFARAVETSGQAGRLERALDLTRAWQTIEPESAKARQMRASLLILANRLDELAPQLASLLAQDKDNLANNLLHLNRMLTRIKDSKAIQQLVEQLTRPYDDLPEAHFAMAEASANANDLPRALEETARALQLRPNWENLLLIRAQLLAQQSGLGAIKELDAFVARNPQARDARLMLARLLVTEKRYDDARAQFELLLRDNPQAPEVIYPIAVIALQQGDLTTGRKQLEHLLDTDFTDKLTVHFLLGQLDQGQNRLDAALAHFREVSGGEQYLAARSRSAQVLMQQGKIDEARQLLHETRTTNAAQRSTLIQAEAQILRESGRHNDAYIVLEAALASTPDDVDLLYDAALVAERLDNPELMEAHIRQLLKIKPDHSHALNALGYSFAERNTRLGEALALATRALEITPDDPFILDTLGWILFRQGELGSALQTLEKAYRLKADPEIAAHLGEVLWTLGRKDEARRLIREALKGAPEHGVLKGTASRLLP